MHGGVKGCFIVQCSFLQKGGFIVMKIVTPLADISHYIPLMQAGAGEYYSGIIPIEWLKKYNMAMPINRREWFLS